jgi:hypothetical protein
MLQEYEPCFKNDYIPSINHAPRTQIILRKHKSYFKNMNHDLIYNKNMMSYQDMIYSQDAIFYQDMISHQDATSVQNAMFYQI